MSKKDENKLVLEKLSAEEREKLVALAKDQLLDEMRDDLEDSVKAEIFEKEAQRIREETTNELRDEIQRKLELKFKGDGHSARLEALLDEVDELEKEKHRCALIMAQEKREHQYQPEAKPHPTKSQLGKIVYEYDISKWSKRAQDANKKYAEIEKQLEKLNHTYLVAELINNPFDNHPYLPGAVNGDVFQLFLALRKQRKDERPKVLIKLMHYRLFLDDVQGREQVGSYTWQYIGETEDGKPINQPFVKQVQLRAKVATEEEIRRGLARANTRLQAGSVRDLTA